MNFKKQERVPISTNSYTFIMTHREEYVFYMEKLELERERRKLEEMEKIYQRKLMEKINTQLKLVQKN